MDDKPTKEEIFSRLTGRKARALAMAKEAKEGEKGEKKALRKVPPLSKKEHNWSEADVDSLTTALNWDKVAPDEGWNKGFGTVKEQTTLTVFKEAKTGRYRWLTITSTAYKDRDKQIVSTKALQQAVAKMDSRGNYGVARWWHVPQLTIGDCDFSHLYGRTLIESGTFRDNRLGEAFKQALERGEDFGVSPGFRHPLSEPDAEGVFHNIDIFERSFLPAGAASNLFTRFVMV